MAAKRILIVDDEQDILDFVSDAFSGVAGYTAECAHDGLEALAAARQYCPDLLILDIQLPKLNGFQVCRSLRVDSVLHRIKILMISGDVMEWDRTEAMLVGANDFLAKPFNPAVLLEKAEELMASQDA